jgi:hypothetical protein
MDPTVDIIDIPLTHQELELLGRGLQEWSGPAACIEDFFARSRRVQAALAGGDPLSPTDWLRTLLATEIVCASNVVVRGSNGPLPLGSTTNTPSNYSEQSSARSSPRQLAYASCSLGAKRLRTTR